VLITRRLQRRSCMQKVRGPRREAPVCLSLYLDFRPRQRGLAPPDRGHGHKRSGAVLNGVEFAPANSIVNPDRDFPVKRIVSGMSTASGSTPEFGPSLAVRFEAGTFALREMTPDVRLHLCTKVAKHVEIGAPKHVATHEF
jgi:hypothetical protein